VNDSLNGTHLQMWCDERGLDSPAPNRSRRWRCQSEMLGGQNGNSNSF